MATFDPAPVWVKDLIREVIDEYYPDLVEAQAAIGAVLARPTIGKDGEEKGPAMVKNGRRVLARIKNNGPEDRAGGKPDATITFDARHLEELEEDDVEGRRRMIALIDHELHHLIVKREKAAPGQKKARVKTDDRGRPLFSMREHDREITGFRAVVERHGRLAAEHREARHFHDTYGNLLFDFASDSAVRRDRTFAREVLALTEEAIEEVNRDHAAAGMPEPFPNAGKKPRKPRGAAVVAATNR